MRTLMLPLLLVASTACATSRAARSADRPDLDLLPTNVSFLATPGAVTWAFAAPVHVVVLEQLSRGPAFRVAYSATPEQLGPLGSFGPVQLLASTATRGPSRAKPTTLNPATPVMPSPATGSQCLSVPVGAGNPEVALNCSPNQFTGGHRAIAGRGVFLRPLMLVVSAAPIDTVALVATDRWVRGGTRPPGTTGAWAVMPLALIR